MSGTPEIVSSSTVASTAATKEKKPVVTRAKSLTQADIDAMIAGAVAKTLADVIPGIVEAVVAKLTPPAPVASEVVSAPVATTTKTTTVTTSTSTNQTWNCQAFVGKIDDRTTPNGKPEIVLHVKPNKDWRYPVAYTTVRDQILALGLIVGDKVALAGFVSVNTPSSGANAGKTYTKFVIRDCTVMSRKADRLAASAASAAKGENTLQLDEIAGDMGVADSGVPMSPTAPEGAVVPSTPASPAQQQVLAQLPMLSDDNPF